MDTPFIANSRTLDDACDLIRLFGPGAMGEAAARAEASRGRDNLVYYVHWRQIERLIPTLVAERPEGRVH